MAFGQKLDLDEIETQWQQAFETGNYEEALNIIFEAHQTDPSNSYYCTKLGGTYFVLQDLKQALVYFLKAVELNPTNPRKYYNLGQCYFKLKNFPEAASAYQKAIHLTPTEELHKLSELCCYLGTSFIELDQLEQASESHAKSIALTLEYLEDVPEDEDCLERMKYYQNNRHYPIIAQAFALSNKFKRQYD